jgi:2-C-methyl-D-erythritol 4-phosphate cytidylyltransferase
MGTALAKQYLKLDGLPLLTRTLLAFAEIGPFDRICLVVPEPDFAYCRREILPPVEESLRVELVPGGESRQQSVYNGLSALPKSSGIVIIHDGVRPFVPIPPTRSAIRHAEKQGACILGIPLTDTLKCVDWTNDISGTLPRGDLWQAQTPQVFAFNLIKKAHDLALSEKFTGTDDASLVEKFGARVRMIYGSPYNIKITTPEDLVIARGILRFCQGKDAD